MSQQEIETLKKRLDRIEEWHLKTKRDHPLSLKERFVVHDRSMLLVRQFEAMVGGVKGDTVCFVSEKIGDQLTMERHVEIRIKDLKDIILNFRKLVDHALGVQYP